MNHDWIFVWLVCALIYMGKALEEYEQSPHDTIEEKVRGSIKFWMKVVCSPVLLITGRW